MYVQTFYPGSGMQLHGFWESAGNILTKAADIGVQVYSAKAQIDQAKAQAKLIAAQTAAAQAAATAQPPVYEQSYPTATQSYPQQYAPQSSQPDWLMPAALIGGMGLIAILLLRK